MWDPENEDEEFCKDNAEEEEGGLFFLLLEDSSPWHDRSLTFKDLLVFVLDGLWDEEGVAAGTGDTAGGVLNVESMRFRPAATWGNAVACDVTEFVSDVVTKAALGTIAEVMM